jgi:hypothetical protein
MIPSAVSRTLRTVTLLPTIRLSVRLSVVGWMIVCVGLAQIALKVHDVPRPALVPPVVAGPHVRR